MSIGTESLPERESVPAPEFAITGANYQPFAAVPTMVFTATATEPSGQEIQSIALNAQVMIDPARRGYDEETRERLSELFGPPASWTPSTQAMAWTRVTAIVPTFTQATSFALEIQCNYDLEVASTKYFNALQGGSVPLSFHFNGTVFYRGADGHLQITPVAWSSSAQYSMPLETWREMITEHYPGWGWIRLTQETLELLNARRGGRGLPSFDAAITELLEATDDDDAIAEPPVEPDDDR